MTARFKDDSYRVPNFGIDGAIPQESWSRIRDKFPDVNEPVVPRIPGFPWWIDPWMPPASAPAPRRPRYPFRPEFLDNSAASSVQMMPDERAGGLLRMLYDVMQERAASLGANNR
ncbi:hypothetical protein QA635_15155 [Bradyrhizobium brasilense]|uniref:hypothetical protein n=1 Tax=Bradyrhizobium brasilense TaxID=1419277 RepID=UPI0024B06691|nr:hypothetical protein [Bradyrhizobium australafricanum]WFU35666.1 hypothetical protein QA635_15155 [Bradyrhizobium australafricanum]